MTEPTPTADELAAMHPEVFRTRKQKVIEALGEMVTAFTAAVTFATIVVVCVAVLFLGVWAIVAAARGIAG